MKVLGSPRRFHGVILDLRQEGRRWRQVLFRGLAAEDAFVKQQGRGFGDLVKVFQQNFGRAFNMEDAIIRWTARLAVAGYVGRLCCDATGRRDVPVQRAGRWAWSFGCVFYLLHVIAAFHFLHGWSHLAAWEHVRQRTLRDIGWDSGFGVYLNYGFTLLWVIDVSLWWRRLDWPERPIPYWTIQVVFAFLMIQATAVFGPRFWLPLCGMVIALLLGIAWLSRSSRGRGLAPATHPDGP